MMMAAPLLLMMARAVKRMLGVTRCLRNFMGTFVVDRLGLLDLNYLDHLVLIGFSVWLRTRDVGLLAGDTALRMSRGRRNCNCHCQSGSQNLVHGLSPRLD